MILVIIKNTVAKEIRRRSFWIILALTAFVIWGMNSLSGSMVMNMNGEVIEGAESVKNTAAFYFISFWNSVLAILLAVDAVRSDFDTGMINSILSRPLSRLDYLLGRFLGVWLTVLLFYLATFTITVLHPGAPGSQDPQSALFFFAALLVDSLKAAAYILWGLLISNFAPKLSSFLGTVVILSIVSVSGSAYLSAGFLPPLPDSVPGLIGYFVYMLTPRTGFIGVITSGIMGFSETPVPDLSLQWIHFSVFLVVLAGINYLIFRRRDCSVR